VVDNQRERETLAGFCPRATLLLLLDAKPKMTRGRDLRIPGLQREIPSRSSPSPLGRFAKRIRGRGRDRAMAWLTRPKFKFNLNPIEKVFENPPNWFPRVSNISIKS
jgi:hypothetical protein